MAIDTNPPIVSSLRASTWKTPMVLAGLAVLLLWRSVEFFERGMLLWMPVWSLYVLTGVLPQLFLLLFPLITRRQDPPGRRWLPPATRLFKEALIAIPVVIISVVSLGLFHIIAYHLFPGGGAGSWAVDRMVRSSGPQYVFVFLLAGTTYAPVAEEVFFRGFLFNSFRNRMPLVVAGMLSSLVFGFCHFVGPIEAVALTLFGLVLTAMYWWRQTIVAPILVHAGYSIVAAVALLLAMEAHRDAAFLGVNSDDKSSCVVSTVTPGSPADQAGIRIGDRLIQFDIYPIQNFQHLLDAVRLYKAGDSVTVTVIRDGDSINLDVVLSSRRAVSIK